ncbi:STAS/SEC14 domain-containing protein [Halarcobacter anaerophilus]|uniref:STAS/SEC14 domain-containing protein n=1 Tax=Halarcobacter anaerophilus TaxID=877500 RepID=UPI0005CAF2FC|nr:STAS/SEC14 domain-containing protein [Halarcobacter anaerophilus]
MASYFISAFKKENKKELPKIDNNVKELDKTENEQIEEENLAISLNDFFVELAVKGKLTHKESQSFKDKIDTLLSNYEVPSINILLDIREFEGIELKGLWDEILFTVKHIKEIKKLVL